MRSLQFMLSLGLLVAPAFLGPAYASGGAVAREPEGEADVVRTVVLLEVGDDGAVVTMRPEVRASAGFAVVLAVSGEGDVGPADRTDGGRLASAVEQTAPRWIAYSSGCGSGPFGGAVPEDGAGSLAIAAKPEPLAGAKAAVVEGTLSSVLAGLRAEGFEGRAPELELEEEGRWLVIHAGGEVPADGPRPGEGPLSTTVRMKLPAGPPSIDLRVAALGRSGRSDIVVIVLADGPMGIEGLSTGRMKTPGAAPDVGADIASDYGRWVDNRVEFVGVGGPVALLEYSGSVKIDGESKHATRYRISLPSGVAIPDQVTFQPDPGLGAHRVRAIVSASLMGPAILALFLLLAIRLRRRLGRLVLPPVLLLALLLAGCPSVGLLHGATVLERGKSEWTYSLAPARDVRHDLNKVSPQSAQNRTPRTVQPEVAWRYGWRDETDVAVRIFAAGAKGEVRTLLLSQAEAGVNVSVGLGLSGFIHPAYGGVCAGGAEGQGDDGCFSSLFGGGAVDVPLLVSRTIGPNEFYFGVRAGGLLMRGTTTYKDPNGVFADEEVNKSLISGLAGFIFGVSLGDRGYRLTPELQILSSRSAGGSLIWFPVVGVGLTPQEPTAQASPTR